MQKHGQKTVFTTHFNQRTTLPKQTPLTLPHVRLPLSGTIRELFQSWSTQQTWVFLHQQCWTFPCWRVRASQCSPYVACLQWAAPAIHYRPQPRQGPRRGPRRGEQDMMGECLRLCVWHGYACGRGVGPGILMCSAMDPTTLWKRYWPALIRSECARMRPVSRKVFVGSRLAAVLCFMLTLGNCCAARDRRWRMHYVLAIRASVLSPRLSTRSKLKFV
jgi:hypothetical protein